MSISRRTDKIRVFVLTDISSLQGDFKEPDDTQSLVRFLLYANEFDVEGLAATYTKHWPGAIKTEYIHTVIDAYAKVEDQLREHDPRFPAAQHLRHAVKAGNPCDGPNYVGEGHDTEASDLIIAMADKDDPRPLWVLVWGGTTDLAQALWRAQQRKSKELFAQFLAKLRVYSISDQYGIGSLIRERYPELFVITSYKSMRGMYKGGVQSLVGPEWVREHVTDNHGPLGAAYPEYEGGDVYGGPVRGVKEGDTPSFLYLIPNGLSDPMEPEWGGWGGRFRAGEGSPRHYFDCPEECGDGHPEASIWAAVYRWRPAYQASFRARLDWCVKSRREANHEPIAVFDGAVRQTVASGSKVTLSARGSYDPDGGGICCNWLFYREPGTYRGELAIDYHDRPEAGFIAPEVDSPQTVHIVLAVTDDGEPPLTSYRRIVFTVVPRTKMVILDDDPTGTQTVSDVGVILRPDGIAFRQFMAGPERAAFVLTNTRALTRNQAESLLKRIAEQIRLEAEQAGQMVALHLRGDSTLRGHVFAEMDILSSERSVGLFVPAFPECGRVTRDGVHYLLDGTTYIPVADTEFARDPVFGFTSGRMSEWVREVGTGWTGMLVSLRDLRNTRGGAVASALLRSQPGTVVIPDAESESDLRMIADGLRKAEAEGRDVVVRSASAFAQIRCGLPSRPPAQEEMPKCRRLLVVCGSHTEAATRQLERFMERYAVHPVIVPTRRLFAGEMSAIVAELSETLLSGLRNLGIALLVSERKREVKYGDLAHGAKVMEAITGTVGLLANRVDGVIAKGGITSAQVATDGLRASSAYVCGQLEAGVSLWHLSVPGGRSRIPYAVIPGNVGHAETICHIAAAFGKQPVH